MNQLQRNSWKNFLASGVVVFAGLTALAQPGETRIQYPWRRKNSYFGVHMGYINYPFSAAQ